MFVDFLVPRSKTTYLGDESGAGAGHALHPGLVRLRLVRPVVNLLGLLLPHPVHGVGLEDMSVFLI